MWMASVLYEVLQQRMRLLSIFFVISLFVYFLTGIPKKYSRKKRLLFAFGTYLVLYLCLLMLVAFGGDLLN